MTHLVAILLNPKDSSGITTTYRNIQVASQVLKVTSFEIVNLVSLPTKDLPVLNQLASDPNDWISARGDLRRGIKQGDLVLSAWGLGGFSGQSKVNFQDQKSWLRTYLQSIGVDCVLTIGGRPRHPSRWRQYLGPQRGLYKQATFELRLEAALTEIKLGLIT